MNYYTTFTIALLLTQTVLVSGQARRYFLVSKTAFLGGDIITRSAYFNNRLNGGNQFAQECDKTPGCVGYTIARDSMSFTLKNRIQTRIPSDGDTYVLDMAVTYTSPVNPLGATIRNRNFTITKDINIIGNDIYNITVESAVNCRPECIRVPGCVGFSFDPRSRNCTLKYQAIEKRIDIGIETYLLNVQSPSRKLYTLPRTLDNFRGKFIGNYDGNFFECPVACDRASNCAAFSLNLATGKGCSLYENGTQPFSQTLQEITFKTYDYNIKSPVPIKEYFEIKGFSYAGEDLGSKVSNDCNTECNSTPGCIQYVKSQVDGSQICKLKGYPSTITSTPGISTFMTVSYEKGNFYSDEISEKQSLYQFDRLVSKDGTSILSIYHDRKLALSKFSFRTRVLAEDVLFTKVNGNGSLHIGYTYGAARFESGGSTGCKTGPWRLHISDEMVLSTRSDSCPGSPGFVSSIDFTRYPFSGYNLLLSQTARLDGPNVNTGLLNSSWGANTVVYYLDSGINPDYDAAHSWRQHHQGDFSFGKTFSNIGSNDMDVYGHGTTMVTILKSNMTGLAQLAKVVSVKITDGEDRFFSERSLIQGIRYAFEDATYPGHSKIINFSGDFPGGSTGDRVKCAMQWAFYRNIAFIAAAGNENTFSKIGTDNPYQFRVGAFVQEAKNIKVWNESNFGPIIDLWAPASVVGRDKIGSSFSTSYVSAVLAAAISQWPDLLANNPNRAYKYLRDSARLDIVPSTDPKIVQSNNMNRAVSMLNIRNQRPDTANYFNPSLSRDFCGLFGLHRTNPSWDTLINGANPTILGLIVSSTNVMSCNDFFSRDCD